jgi:hypothetical protein
MQTSIGPVRSIRRKPGYEGVPKLPRLYLGPSAKEDPEAEPWFQTQPRKVDIVWAPPCSFTLKPALAGETPAQTR